MAALDQKSANRLSQRWTKDRFVRRRKTEIAASDLCSKGGTRVFVGLVVGE